MTFAMNSDLALEGYSARRSPSAAMASPARAKGNISDTRGRILPSV